MMERLLDAPAEMLGKGRAYVRHTLAPGVTIGQHFGRRIQQAFHHHGALAAHAMGDRSGFHLRSFLIQHPMFHLSSHLQQHTAECF